MKIIESSIVGVTLNIKLDGETEVDKVYFDSLTNEDNFFATNDELHTNVVKINKTVSEINIDITKVKETAFIVTVIGELPNNPETPGASDYYSTYVIKDTVFTFDEDALYRAKIKMLETFCNTCLDKSQKSLIITSELRSNIFYYALKNEAWSTVVSTFKDLARILIYLNIDNSSVYDEGYWNYLGDWNCQDLWACKPDYNGKGDCSCCSPCENGCCAI